MRFVGSALLLALVSASCSSSPETPRACTLIGCESGLEVQLVGAPAAPYRIEASAPGQASPHIIECTARAPCGPNVFLRDFTPEVATIRVIVGADATTRSVQPTYETVQPNGPGCPPTCRHGKATIDLGR